ncbi:hypothetical protein ES702_03054 [subsurface metagenome]
MLEHDSISTTSQRTNTICLTDDDCMADNADIHDASENTDEKANDTSGSLKLPVSAYLYVMDSHNDMEVIAESCISSNTFDFDVNDNIGGEYSCEEDSDNRQIDDGAYCGGEDEDGNVCNVAGHAIDNEADDETDIERWDVASRHSGSSRGDGKGLALLLGDNPVQLTESTEPKSTSFVKGTDETAKQFRERVISLLNPKDNWRVSTSSVTDHPIIDKEALATLKSEASSKIELFLPKPDKNYGADDIESGRHDPVLATKSLYYRRTHLRSALIDLGIAHGVKRGKWILAANTYNMVHETFFKLVEALEEWSFGTAVEAAWYATHGKGVVSIWIEEQNDNAELWKPVIALWDLGITETVHFKPEIFTVLDMRSYNDSGVQIIETTSREFNWGA